MTLSAKLEQQEQNIKTIANTIVNRTENAERLLNRALNEADTFTREKFVDALNKVIGSIYRDAIAIKALIQKQLGGARWITL